MSSESFGSDTPGREKAPRLRFPCPVRRVRLKVEEGKWEIVKQVEIPSMTIKESAALPSTARGRTGFWVEAVDSQGRLVYRTLAPNPFRRSAELFDASGQPIRIERPEEEILIDILIPDRPEIAELVIYSNVTIQGKRLRRAEVLQRVLLERQEDKGGQGGYE